MQLKALPDTCYQHLEYSAHQSTPFLGCSSHHQNAEANTSLDKLKEQLADVVDEIVSINNKHKVNMVIKKIRR
jgi:NTP pyrophosphatase (non-canonical NTP hydrolase)